MNCFFRPNSINQPKKFPRPNPEKKEQPKKAPIWGSDTKIPSAKKGAEGGIKSGQKCLTITLTLTPTRMVGVKGRDKRVGVRDKGADKAQGSR